MGLISQRADRFIAQHLKRLPASPEAAQEQAQVVRSVMERRQNLMKIREQAINQRKGL